MFIESAHVTRENYKACLQKISRSPSASGLQPGYIDTLRSNDMARQRRPGIPGRLNQLQGKANETMDTAQGVMLRLEAVVRGAVDEAIDELLDGFTFELEIGGKTMPVKLRMIAME